MLLPLQDALFGFNQKSKITLMTNDLNDTLTNHCILRWRQTMGIILLVVLLYVVPTECTDHTEAYGFKLFESTEWPTLRDARIHRNECLLVCVQAKEIQVQEPCAAIDGNHT